MARASSRTSARKSSRSTTTSSRKFHDVLMIAEREGLLRGERTKVVRGRMPEALVSEAKKRTGIESDTDLIEVALANIAVADDYAEWLLSRRGAVDSGVQLEF
jgi:hypothetical protein